MRPRLRVIAALLVLGLLAPAGALADQNDPRLERLFTRLHATTSRAEARSIEQEIWRVWHRAADPAVNRLMAEGVRAMARRDLAQALARFDRLVAQAPDFAEAWNRRATVHYMMGDYRASVADIQRTLTLEPRHFGALSGLGLIYDGIERPGAALRSYEAALEINPHLEGTRERIEELRRKVQGRAT